MPHISTTTARRALMACAAGLAALVLAGCATLAGGPPEKVVRERAQERWAALIAGDFPKAYRLMPPSYRASTPVERFVGSFQGGVKWVKADVVWVKCETDDKCIARMNVDSLVAFNRGTTPLNNAWDETWIREDGGWWLFPTR
jgi:hypothetical protein